MASLHSRHVRLNHVARFSTAMTTVSGTIPKVSTLTKSILTTDHFQRSLPTLKVPPLNKTVARYLDSQKALLEPEQLEKTSRLASKFLTDRGPNLQQVLVDYARTNQHTSYITQMWFDMYLTDRRPVVLTHNPVIVMNDTQRGAGYERPSIRATNLVHSMLKFCKLLRSKTLEPEIFHMNPKKSNTPFFHQAMRIMPDFMATYAAYMFNAYPLDMSQYASMFNGTRIPKPSKDELFSDASARHILVIHKGQTYVFDVFDDNGNPIPASELLANLEFITQQPNLPNAPGLGTITALPRDDAAAARERLIQLGNEPNLKLVDSAFVALVLDDSAISDVPNMLLNFLAGPSESRWFDKCLSLIVDRRGKVAVNFEHSWGDGVAVVRLCNDIYADSESNPAVGPEDLHHATSQSTLSVHRLEWLIDDRMAAEVLQPARDAYNRRRALLTFDHARITDGLSKRVCKQTGLSPDAMMQLGFQLAHDMVHEQPAATYESCSTAAFKHGRTETLRSATVETRRCVELMHRPLGVVVSQGGSSAPARNAVSREDLLTALAACSFKHNLLTKEAAMGQGWDRHLLALRHLALKEDGRPLPDIFLDDSYAHINRIILSTSTLSSPTFSMGGFAPVQNDGYGIGYGIQDDHCGLLVSSWLDAPTANASQLVEAFCACTRRIASLTQQPPSSTDSKSVNG